MTKSVTFNDAYYRRVMSEFGYDPIAFGRINFSLGGLTDGDLQRRWLCHHDGDIFATALKRGEKAIVSTGFGLSGVPHIGTVSQILRAITLQREGIPVNMVLGDLDAYNGKARPLAETRELADKYAHFVRALGFKDEAPSILRSQFDATDVMRTAYLIGHYMDDEMFDRAEEDLHGFYSRQGKVDSHMSYRRKLSLNLMTADFLHLSFKHGFKHVMVMLGIDEHKYVGFGRETLKRLSADGKLDNLDMRLSGMYSGLIKGLYGYPKMSKSFPDSGITADMPAGEIRRRIMDGEGAWDVPENNVVYQMMAGASLLDAGRIRRNYESCLNRTADWQHAKKEYADMLVDICAKWRSI